MGWFLIGHPGKKKKSSKKRASRGAAAGQRPPWDPKRTLAGLKFLAAAGLVLAVVLGWIFGYGGLENYVRRTHAHPVVAADVHLAHAPGWMSRAVRARLKRTVAERVTADPLDAESLTLAARALARVPWVRRVEQVHRLEDGRIVVRALYRRPLALIEARNGYYLVGQRGTQLLAQPYYRKQLSRLGLPTITGVRSAPPARPGERWTGRDVQGGLRLIRLLSHEPFFHQIFAVNVSRHDARGRVRLVIHTRDGGTILWGYAPGCEQAIEPSAEQKIKRLCQVAADFDGSVDADGRTVEIFGAAIQTERPIVGTQRAMVGYAADRR